MSVWHCTAVCGDLEIPFIMVADPAVSFVETLLSSAEVIAGAESWPPCVYELWVLAPPGHAYAGAWRLQDATLEWAPGGLWLGHSNFA